MISQLLLHDHVFPLPLHTGMWPHGRAVMSGRWLASRIPDSSSSIAVHPHFTTPRTSNESVFLDFGGLLSVEEPLSRTYSSPKSATPTIVHAARLFTRLRKYQRQGRADRGKKHLLAQPPRPYPKWEGNSAQSTRCAGTHEHQTRTHFLSYKTNFRQQVSFGFTFDHALARVEWPLSASGSTSPWTTSAGRQRCTGFPWASPLTCPCKTSGTTF